MSDHLKVIQKSYESVPKPLGFVSEKKGAHSHSPTKVIPQSLPKSTLLSPSMSTMTPEAHKQGTRKVRRLSDGHTFPQQHLSSITDQKATAEEEMAEEALKNQNAPPNEITANLLSFKQDEYLAKDGKASTLPVVLTWRNDVKIANFLSFSRVKYNRIMNDYSANEPSSTFKEMTQLINRYLREKYITYGSENNIVPFSIPSSFFRLIKSVLKITHQMFTNPVLFSGEVSNFSSEDESDIVFGSSGIWANLEAETEGAAGQYFADSRSVAAVISMMERNIQSASPYCRVVAVPVFKESEVFSTIFDVDFFGDVLALIPKERYEYLPRNIDLFREGFRESLVEEDSSKHPDFIAIIIWMNEHYRSLYRSPSDVDDCFLAWSASCFETTDIVQLSAFPRVFPYRLRTTISMEEEFHE